MPTALQETARAGRRPAGPIDAPHSSKGAMHAIRRLLAALTFIGGGIGFELTHPVQCQLLAPRRTTLNRCGIS